MCQQVSKETKHFVPGALDYPEDRTKCSVTTPIAVQASQQVTSNHGKGKTNQVVPILSRPTTRTDVTAQATGKVTESMTSRASLNKEPQDGTMDPMLKFGRSSPSRHRPTTPRRNIHPHHVDITDSLNHDHLETAKQPSLDASGHAMMMLELLLHLLSRIVMLPLQILRVSVLKAQGLVPGLLAF